MLKFRYKPDFDAPLAGERLRPLGHVSADPSINRANMRTRAKMQFGEKIWKSGNLDLFLSPEKKKGGHAPLHFAVY